jgi:protein TonB
VIKRALVIAAIVLAGCDAPAPPEPPKPAPPPQQVAPPAPPLSLDDYKRHIAGAILTANSALTYEGTPPHLLRAVVVLELTIDASGAVRGVRTLRTPDDELAAVAVRSARAAGPLLAPPPELLRRGELQVVETWLFRDDGRFQVRTLAEPQARLAEEPVVRTR